MNKAPQPTGPPPARSPGLPQPAFPPGQTAPVVFSTPQATQMNTPSQPRQHFYPSRAQPPSSAASRVQSAFPASVAPAPVLMNQPPQIAPKRERKTVSSS
uniref:Eukaryotic translation initiation factor 4 gamma 1 n=1 Tax=Mus spicilegus TaxID=10103 RepID=A0A8C6HBL5_MUSSI